MKNKISPLFNLALASFALFAFSCEDEVSNIGNSISSAEVTINIDSITYNLKANSIEAPALESKSNFTLLGSITVPEYGDLNCSYVTEFLPSENIEIPDSISIEDIDSVKMFLRVPKQYITGDSLALQQIKVFNLTRRLPSDIKSGFDADGYYNPAEPLAVKNFTLSGYTYNDTAFISSQNIEVGASLPVETGKSLLKQYRENPDLFVWPQNFADYWPGIYVTPSFGRGCLSPVQSTSVYLYYPVSSTSTTTNDDGEKVTTTVTVADSVCVLTTAPEVLSNVNINYRPAESIKNLIGENKSIITTPGGYAVSFTFPAQDILREYWKSEYDLGVINNMVFSIPAKSVPNSYGIGLPPALLMVKSSEMDTFFAEGKIPDNKSSFFSLLSSDSNTYTFSSMREYIVALREKGEEAISADDVNFTLIPVNVSTEDYTDPYTGSSSTAVTSISPYLLKPTMVELETDKALIVFTYSNQTLN